MHVGAVSGDPSQQLDNPLSSVRDFQSTLLNMSAQTRVFGNKTFNAIGYGGMGLSMAYGSVGTDEERLKVILAFPVVIAGG